MCGMSRQVTEQYTKAIKLSFSLRDFWLVIANSLIFIEFMRKI